MTSTRILFASLRLGAILAAISAAPVTRAQGLGTTAESGGPRLQARVGLQTGLAADRLPGLNLPTTGVLLGDYYFSRSRLGSGDVSGGFRATSGLLLGQRSLALGTPALSTGQGLSLTLLKQSRWAQPAVEADAWSAQPYVGLGWSGLSARGGWGVSADFGFTTRPTSSGLRASSNNLDDLLRELRLNPVLQLGVSYAF